MARVEYREPKSVDEALALLGEYGEDAKVLAGGQSLLVMMRDKLVQPRVLVALQGIPGLDTIVANGELRIGAMATHSAVESHPAVRKGWPMLSQAEAAVSTLQIRNRGTLVGNVAHGFPNADPPAALIAVGAQARIVGPGGSRALPIEDLFVGFMQTALAPSELLAELSIPVQPPRSAGAYLKYAIRPLDFSIVGVAARVTVGTNGACAGARIGLNGAGGRPLRARSAEAALQSVELTDEVIAEAARRAADECDPVSDLDGSAKYKRRMVEVFVRRALRQALVTVPR
jgi:aerobic carbon-monoxide dehydrogenase medium subunit